MLKFALVALLLAGICHSSPLNKKLIQDAIQDDMEEAQSVNDDIKSMTKEIQEDEMEDEEVNDDIKSMTKEIQEDEEEDEEVKEDIKTMENDILEDELNDQTLVIDKEYDEMSDDEKTKKITGPHKPIDEINGESEHLFEGDMLNTVSLQANIKRLLLHEKGYATGDDASTARNSKWENARVPYSWADDPIMTNNQRAKDAIAAAIAEYTAKTCIKFVPKTAADTNYLNIIVGQGCYSYIGKINRGGQDVSIGRGCEYKGIVIHEFAHALGFYHEQSRNDRDEFITIDFTNIKPGTERNFQKYQAGSATTHGAGYDKQSVMHYSNKAFAVDRSQNTITSKSDPNEVLGQRDGLSAIDIEQINKHYECAATTTTVVATAAPAVTAAPTEAPVGPVGPDAGGAVCKFFEENLTFCKDPVVKNNCESTCAAAPVCTAENLAGKYFDSCDGWKKYCTYARFSAFMNKYCAKTCTCEE